MDAGVLIGYFGKRDEAREALKELRRKGYRRAAMVSKGADGEVRRFDPFRRRLVFGAAVAFIACGTIASILAVVLSRPGSDTWSPQAISVIGAVVIGIALCAALI